MAVYAPPKDHVLKDKEKFYHKLDSVVEKNPTGEVLVIVGISMRRLAVIWQDMNCISVPTAFEPLNVKNHFSLD